MKIKSCLKLMSLIIVSNLVIFNQSILAINQSDLFATRNNILFYSDSAQDCDNITDVQLFGNQSAGEATYNKKTQSFSLKAPEIKDANALAKAIDDWIAQNAPKSPLKGIGKIAVSNGQKAGVNPVLPVLFARSESSFGTNPKGQALIAINNYYGRKATSSQPHKAIINKKGGQTLWYKWNSPQASFIHNPSNPNGDMFGYIKNNSAWKKHFNDDDLSALIHVYAPKSDGNKTEQYIKSLNTWYNEIMAKAGISAVDNTQIGAVDEPSDMSNSINDCLDDESSSGGVNFMPGTGPTGSGPGFQIIDGIKIFYQRSQPGLNVPWETVMYDKDCGSMGRCGCGVASLTTVIANYRPNQSIALLNILKQVQNGGYTSGEGTYHSAMTAIPKMYGLTSTQTKNAASVKKALEEKKLVIAILGGKVENFYGGGGHFVVIRGIDNGKILFGDPARVKNNTQKWDPIILNRISNVGHFWIISDNTGGVSKWNQD